jgi:hypothetical protein
LGIPLAADPKGDIHGRRHALSRPDSNGLARPRAASARPPLPAPGSARDPRGSCRRACRQRGTAHRPLPGQHRGGCPPPGPARPRHRGPGHRCPRRLPRRHRCDLRDVSGLSTVTITSRNVGAARRAGTRAALRGRAGPARELWLARTDADSAVPADWLTVMVRAAGRGADLLLGTVLPGPDLRPSARA